MNKFSDENMCRICFTKQETLYSLFRKRKGIPPCEMLIKLGLKADANDAGPPSICCDCLTDLETTVSFLEKCEKSNQILAEHCRGFDFTEEICYKNVLDLEDEIPVNYENRLAESNQDLNESVVEEVKSDVLGFEAAKCTVCGSRRRCGHWTPPATHTCPYCQKVFSRKFNFKLHLKRHSGEREWSCAQCGASAVSSWLAASHCAPRRRRPCPVPGCGKTYTTNTNLNTHLRMHSGERPFECIECAKKFTSKNTLNEHMRIHTGALPYICPICGKRFRTNKLSVHMNTHSDSRHECVRAGCTKRFTTRVAMLRHARAHAHSAAVTSGASVGGQAPSPQHVCSLCPARYHHKQSLNKHVKKQHMQKSTPIEVDTTEKTEETQCDI